MAQLKSSSRNKTGGFLTPVKAIGIAVAVIAVAGLLFMLAPDGAETPAQASSRQAPVPQGQAPQAAPPSPGGQPEISQSTLEACTVAIQTNDSAGSGVIIGQDLVVTNDHVIRSAVGTDQNILIETRSGDKQIIPARDLILSRARFDLALIRTPKPLAGSQAVLLRQAPREKGMPIVAVGHPEGERWKVTRGYITNFLEGGSSGEPYASTTVLKHDAHTYSGNSGGGVFDLQSHLIGINSAIRVRKAKGPMGDGVALPDSKDGFAIPVEVLIQEFGSQLQTSGAQIK